MNKFFSGVFKDANGEYSSKRFITFTAFIQFLLYFNLNMTMNLKVEETLLGLLSTVIFVGLGVTTVEGVFKKKVDIKKEDA